MISESLERLEACHVALIAALDSDNVEAIEAAVGGLRDAVEEVRAQGSWRDKPEVAEMVDHIYRLAEAARVRVNFLTEMNQQRIEALSIVRGRTVVAPYRRDGSQFA